MYPFEIPSSIYKDIQGVPYKLEKLKVFPIQPEVASFSFHEFHDYCLFRSEDIFSSRRSQVR